MTGSSLTLDIGGRKVWALAEGPSDGVLALLLHGFPDSPYTWRHLMRPLAEAGYRAVAPAMRGYAPSGPAAGGRYDTETLGRDVNDLHDALSGKHHPAVLIGHGWGADAVYAALLADPRRWSAAVAASDPPRPNARRSGQSGATTPQLVLLRPSAPHRSKTTARRRLCPRRRPLGRLVPRIRRNRRRTEREGSAGPARLRRGRGPVLRLRSHRPTFRRGESPRSRSHAHDRCAAAIPARTPTDASASTSSTRPQSRSQQVHGYTSSTRPDTFSTSNNQARSPARCLSTSAETDRRRPIACSPRQCPKWRVPTAPTVSAAARPAG
jgi:pimeloyl-ACP methyl ester carboxylesterase